MFIKYYTKNIIEQKNSNLIVILNPKFGVGSLGGEEQKAKPDAVRFLRKV